MKRVFFSMKIILGFIALLFLSNCKVPYDPPVVSSNYHFLVVEGYINANGLTTMKLSRTRNITWGDTAAYRNESGADVVIEDNQNNIYPLYENGEGNYSSYNYLNATNKYRLRINTSDHKEYLSDFVSCKVTPPIDNLGWKITNGNVQVFVNTHDPENKTRFYLWDYVETWEFHSQYYSTLQFVTQPNIAVVDRPVPVFVCYRTDNSNNILLGSSVKLDQDVIHEASLGLIPDHDRRLSVLYSTIVNQYALDSIGYNYWSALKSNTENVGSIFDPQPNQTRGNIHCTTDSSETVIGYIGAGTIQQSRIFISNSSLPNDWNEPKNCTEKYVTPDSIKFYFGDNSFIPYAEDPPGALTPKGYFSASATCVDCTLTGTPDKPSFWP